MEKPLSIDGGFSFCYTAKGEKMQAIYKITNKINGKFYIGSTNNITKRWNNHKSKLNNGIHENSYLQLAWSKYGESSFEFSILEEVSNDNRIEREIYYLNETKCYKRDIGYNFDKNPVDKSGSNNPFYGKKHSVLSLNIMKEKANNRNEEVRKRMGEKNKGKGIKLNIELAREIRKLYSTGNETYRSLMKKFNVAQGTIQAILTNRIWVE